MSNAININNGNTHDQSTLEEKPPTTPLLLLSPGRHPPILPERLRLESLQATQVGDSEIYYYFAESQRIGRGAFSEVFKGHFKSFEQKSAVKCIDLKDDKSIQDCENELTIWKTLQDDDDDRKHFIVKLLGYALDGRRAFIAMELADRTLQHEILYEEKILYYGGHTYEADCIVNGYLRNIAAGLEYLHSKNIVHRDIKPLNILIFKDRNPALAKLSDFGLSRELSESRGSISLANGTLRWMAPEAKTSLFTTTKFLNTKAIDIYSLGMVGLYCINYRRRSTSHYADPDELGCIGPMDLRKQASGNHLFHWMTQNNPSKRPSIQACVSHPYLWEKDMDTCLKFLIDIVSTVVNPPKLDDWKEPRIVELCINKTYMWYITKKCKSDNIWGLVDPRFEEMKKEYVDIFVLERHSVMSWCQFIVDMIDSPPKTLAEIFGSNDTFNKEDFIKFFLEGLPDMVVIMFCLLSTVAPRFPFLKKLKETYFENWIGVYETWSDDIIPECVEYFLKTLKDLEERANLTNLPNGFTKDVIYTLPNWKGYESGIFIDVPRSVTTVKYD